VAARVCWQCGTRIIKGDRHCPECGADQWNRPQGAAARNAALFVPSAATPAPAYDESMMWEVAKGVFLGLLMFSALSAVVWFIFVIIFGIG